MPEQNMALLRACAVWCQRYAPLTMIEQRPGHRTILVDLTGCDRVHPCDRALMQRVCAEFAVRGFESRVAIASTAAAACAFAHGRTHASRTARAPRKLAQCSLRALRIAPDALDALRQVNVRTIGQLAKLPRASVTVRYGSDTLRRLDEALGSAVEYFQPIRSTPPPSSQRIFDGPVSNMQGIQLTVVQLLDDVCHQLRQRMRGGREFEVVATCADAPVWSRRLTLGAPSTNERHIANMFAPMMERIEMGMGVESISLAVLRMGRLCPVEAVAEWVDTLTARLGPQAVFRSGFVEDHRPTRSMRWISVARCGLAASVALRDASVRAVCAWRPSIQFEREQAVRVQCACCAQIEWRGRMICIRSWNGPERILAPWNLREANSRDAHTDDFWRVESDDGRWLWLRQSSDGWSLVGIWS